VEANFNVDYAASRLVNSRYDAEMNYTRYNYVSGWQRMIDLYLGLFPRSGMATHDQCGGEGWENGKVVNYSPEQKLETARTIRDYLVTQHKARKGGTKPIVRCCGGNSDTKLWGVPGTLAHDKPPPSNYALLMWEIRETADVGFEPNGLGGKPYTPVRYQWQGQNNVTTANAAGMRTMLDIELYYNGRFLEIKRPDLITNFNKPNGTYTSEFANTSAAMAPGLRLPWICPGDTL
jgi:hypothetical protein